MSKSATEVKFLDVKSTPHARGKRVETLRRMAHLSRRAFREKYGIAPSTLQNWEDVKGNGLTEKGARKIIASLKPDGILCTFEWLMYGVGPGPQILENFHLENSSRVLEEALNEVDEVAAIARELIAFRANFPETAVNFIVNDDGMEPRFITGEHVAGTRRFGEEIDKLVGLDCIVQTTSGGEVLLRTLKKAADNSYTLACRNPNADVDKPILYQVDIVFAAPVIWARRKNY